MSKKEKDAVNYKFTIGSHIPTTLKVTEEEFKLFSLPEHAKCKLEDVDAEGRRFKFIVEGKDENSYYINFGLIWGLESSARSIQYACEVSETNLPQIIQLGVRTLLTINNSPSKSTSDVSFLRMQPGKTYLREVTTLLESQVSSGKLGKIRKEQWDKAIGGLVGMTNPELLALVGDPEPILGRAREQATELKASFEDVWDKIPASEREFVDGLVG